MSKPTKRSPARAPEEAQAPSAQNESATPSAPIARVGAMTIDRWAKVTHGGKNQALIESFAVCERLAHQATRKLTPDEWREAFGAWCAETRI